MMPSTAICPAVGVAGRQGPGEAAQIRPRRCGPGELAREDDLAHLAGRDRRETAADSSLVAAVVEGTGAERGRPVGPEFGSGRQDGGVLCRHPRRADSRHPGSAAPAADHDGRHAEGARRSCLRIERERAESDEAGAGKAQRVVDVGGRGERPPFSADARGVAAQQNRLAERGDRITAATPEGRVRGVGVGKHFVDRLDLACHHSEAKQGQLAQIGHPSSVGRSPLRRPT